MARITGPASAGVAQLMSYGFSILSAIRAGGKVSDLWNAVYAAGLESGAGKATIFDMNYVASRWRAVSNAMDAFAAARGTPANQITGSMIAPAPWTNLGPASVGGPEYQVRFAVTVAGDNGISYDLNRSVTFHGSLTGYTTDDVLGFAQQAADKLAQDQGGTPPFDTTGEAVTGEAGPVDPLSIQILRV